MIPHSKWLSPSLLACGLIAAQGFLVSAQAELSFNVGVFSDYLSDGASASDNNAVVQGGVDYNHESGFFLGTWMSTLGSGEGQEVDLYAGYDFAVGDFDFGVGYTYYYYTSLDDEDSGELNLTAGFGPMYLGLDYTLHADDSSAEGDITYRIGGEYEFMPTMSVVGELGYYDPDARGADGVTFWSLGLVKATNWGDFSLTYGSTDESGSDDLFVVGFTMTF